MNMFQAVSACFSQFATFSGRARRAEYWWFFLFNVLAASILAAVSETLSGVFSLVTLLPTLAVSVRRLHDIDRSGWWLLLMILPLIGPIVLLVWSLTRGTAGINNFGDDPKLPQNDPGSLVSAE